MTSGHTRTHRPDAVAPRQTRKLSLGPVHDARETEASRIAALVSAHDVPRVPLRVQHGGGGPSEDGSVPSSVHATLGTSGQPLDGSTRAFMEQRFGHRFDHVRVYDGTLAARSAHEIGALAYTVGSDIVFGAGSYAPASPVGRRVLAHELTHVVQNTDVANASIIRCQPHRPRPRRQTAPQTAPRPDFVFIMGKDPGRRREFYTYAERYFRSHIPNATFVTTIRNLEDLLSYIATNVNQPIGNIYIVAHAAEDGTLSFGLNSSDADRHLEVRELRSALHPATGTSRLTGVRAQVDAQTRIHIKGCDIGRTKEMVELVDEAFGGAGTVSAPTHEQVYGSDAQLERRERTRFRAAIAARHQAGPAVNPSLRGAARIQAQRQHAAAERQRQRDIRQDIAAHQAQEDVSARRAATYEALSGPMFQRTGSQLFTATELAPRVQQLYSHLSAVQQQSLVRQLIAPDRRPVAIANRQGPYQQHGQRAYRLELYRDVLTDPQSAQEANRLFAAQFRQAHFHATAAPTVHRTPVSGGHDISVDIPGRSSPPGQQPFNDTFTMTMSDPEPTDVMARTTARTLVPNPGRYTWTPHRAHANNGQTTRTVVAERVVAYLHHQSLDPAAHDHFTRPESDPDFFATSTFAPPRPRAVRPRRKARP